MTTRQKRITELNRVKRRAITGGRRAALQSRERANKDQPKLLVGVKNILVPTDFSEQSLDALAYAENIAEVTGAKLTLINVVEPVVLPVPLTTLAMDNDRIIRGTNTKLKKLAAEHGIGADMLDRIVVSEGAAWNEIVRAARNLKCDLIVIATHGRSGLEHAFLGSTAERVIRHAHCPVLVVR
jgi:nucleotide-binding universal stress UspA family protein